MIKVLFFAKLSEQLAVRELLVEADQVKDMYELYQYLLSYQPGWSKILESQTLLKAVNQTMTSENLTLKVGDEVAFFPPVTGG